MRSTGSSGTHGPTPSGTTRSSHDPIDPTTQSMPVFVADHGWLVDGVKTNRRYYPYPDNIPELAGPQPVPYTGPLELDGTPVKIYHTRWPVGYHRQKDVWTIIQEVVYVGATLFAVPWFLSKPGAEAWAFLFILLLLIIIPWLEWSSRCEDRVRVQRAAIVFNAALAAIAVHQHHEAKEREAARVIRNEDIQRDYEKRCAATDARIAEMQGESAQAEANFRASQDWTR